MDIFPSYLTINTVRLPENYWRELVSKPIPRYDDYFVCTLHCNMFKPSKELGKVSEKKLDEHFRYALRHGLQPKAIDNKLIEWYSVHTHLQPFPRSSVVKDKNLDQNLAYRFGKVFLTKKYFTFGLRNTGADTCHVYQTYKRPLLFFLPKDAVTYPEGYFPHEYQNTYDCFLLEPDSDYLVDENTTYLIISPDITLFSLAILETSSKMDGKVYKSPTDTPFILTMKQEFYSTPKVLHSFSKSRGPSPIKLPYQNASNSFQVPEEENSQRFPDRSPFRGQKLDNNTMTTATENSSGVPADLSNFSRGIFQGSNINTRLFNRTTPPDISVHENGGIATEAAHSLNEDSPAPFEKTDACGNTYLFIPMDMNWKDKDRRPIDIYPYMVNFNGRCFTYVPVKISRLK